MDFTLSFLDDFVADALESGAKPYKPISLRHRQKQYSKGNIVKNKLIK